MTSDLDHEGGQPEHRSSENSQPQNVHTSGHSPACLSETGSRAAESTQSPSQGQREDLPITGRTTPLSQHPTSNLDSLQATVTTSGRTQTGSPASPSDSGYETHGQHATSSLSSADSDPSPTLPSSNTSQPRVSKWKNLTAPKFPPQNDVKLEDRYAFRQARYHTT